MAALPTVALAIILKKGKSPQDQSVEKDMVKITPELENASTCVERFQKLFETELEEYGELDKEYRKLAAEFCLAAHVDKPTNSETAEEIL